MLSSVYLRVRTIRAVPLATPPRTHRSRGRPARLIGAGAGVLAAVLSVGCGGGSKTGSVAPSPLPRPAPGQSGGPNPLNVYAADGPNMLSPVVRHDPALVYVPNSISDTVDVISQKTFRIVEHFQTGGLPQHVTPSYDLKTLYVDNDSGNSLTPINPRTGVPGPPDTGRGSLQPVFHPRRPVRDRRGRATPATRLPRSAHDAPRPLAHGAHLPRRRPHGLLGGRSLRVRQLRVRRADDQDRPDDTQGRRRSAPGQRPDQSPGRQARPGRPAPLLRRPAERRGLGDRSDEASASSAFSAPAPEPTACTRVAARS